MKRFFVYGVVGFLLGCNAAEDKKGPDVEKTAADWELLAAYQQCGRTESTPSIDVVREIDLTGFALPSYGGMPPSIPVLATGQLGVWFYLGQRPSSGYEMTLDDAKTSIEDGELRLAVNESKPHPDKFYAQSLISPCIILSVKDGSFNSVRAEGNATGLPIGLALE